MRTRMLFRQAWQLILVALPMAAAPIAIAAPTVHIAKGKDSLRVEAGGQPLFTYAWGDTLPRPYIADIFAPDGTRITRRFPPDPQRDAANDDHADMHPGLWVAFGDIGGIDVWRLKGRVRQLGFVEAPRLSGDTARFAVRLRYESMDTPPRAVCEATCHYSVQVRSDHYTLVVRMAFTALEAGVAFGDQEEMGLGVRLDTPLAVRQGGRILNSDGGRDEAGTWGKAADWAAADGVVDGRRAGVLIVPAPQNFRRSWFHSRDYGLLVANPFGRKAMTAPEDDAVAPDATPIPTEGALELGYAVTVFSSDANADMNHAALHAEALTRLSPAPDWTRHIVDDTSAGADGVRLADANGDARPDIVTGWEEGGETRVYLHPGAAEVRAPWPRVTVGQSSNVEDAVFVDLDADGALDVVSCSEGDTRQVFVHWAPTNDYTNAAAWRSVPIPAAAGRTQWMFALPMQVDGENGIDLVVAGKGDGSLVGWLEAPANPRDLAAWRLHPVCDAGWVMSLGATDVDSDGDEDIVLSDRKGTESGVYWLERPAPESLHTPWPRHMIGALGHEVMFLDIIAPGEIVAAVRPNAIHRFRAGEDPAQAWTAEAFTPELPAGLGTAKAVAAADIDADGVGDLVYSCENAWGARRGVVWLQETAAGWAAHDISGPEGVKFDLVVPVDLDGDGDLDVLTCEETEGLGVVWYENPVARRP